MTEQQKQEILKAVDERVKDIWGHYTKGEKKFQQILAAFDAGRMDFANELFKALCDAEKDYTDVAEIMKKVYNNTSID